MSIDSTLNGSENIHYVYRQISPVILTNTELTEEVQDLRMRLALVEEILYSDLNEKHETESDTATN